MRKAIFFLVFLFVCFDLFSQNASYPDVTRKGEKDVYIRSVVTTDYYTRINFIYNNSKPKGHYIFLNLPGDEDAYFIIANGKRYNLLSTENIGNSDGITIAMPDEIVEFSAMFEKLPTYIEEFDLIEGANGPWDFYGVKLDSPSSTSEHGKPEKFRVDYNYVAIFDSNSETWSDWEKGDNTFVININDRGDIAHLRADGENLVYKKLSSVEEGYTEEGNYHYQIIEALDEEGDVFSLQIFDDVSIGLKMIWGSVMIQFARL